MRELEEVDSASRGAAVHSAPSGCPSTLYMGTTKIRGQKSFFIYIFTLIKHLAADCQERAYNAVVNKQPLSLIDLQGKQFGLFIMVYNV